MASPARTRATILAHHLYDFAECEHRIALDVSLDRELRTPPDAAMELLYRQGQEFERTIVGPLGFPAVTVEQGNWDRAFAQTVALMRDGVAGIDQGVLIDGARLARPDLLERVAGASELGEFHYVPGDVKSARAARSDAAFQVGFAALLLERVQGRRPDTGFLILGDGRRETLDLESIRFTIEDAVARAEDIARGEVTTTPFFSSKCARCRWRGECLPKLEQARDLSFVHGMTRARRRALSRHGVTSIDALAEANLERLVAHGVPSDGLLRLREQARALIEGRVIRRGAARLSRIAGRELYLLMETDPLDGGEPFSIAWGETAGGETLSDARVEVVSSVEERASALREVFESFESPGHRGAPIFTFGSGTATAFDALAEAQRIDPARAGDLAGRLVDLAPWVRRAAVLPIFRYGFDEVSAVVRGRPRPSPGQAEDAPFVLHAGMVAHDDPDRIRRSLEAAGVDALESLHAIRKWLAA
jgi:predicted RecB family nuclease